MYKATINLLKAIIVIGHRDSWNVVVVFILHVHECVGECRDAFLGWF